MRVAVVGSRGFPDPYERVERWVVPNLYPNGYTIVSGGARGIDQAAHDVADDYGYEYEEFPADWDRYGRGAGYRRNAEMIPTVDQVVVFWDGVSRGARHAIDLALEHKIDLEVIFP